MMNKVMMMMMMMMMQSNILLRSAASEMERWSGRVALVTGGSAGIGAAVVRRLAGHGLKVVACGRRVDKIQVNVTELG